MRLDPEDIEEIARLVAQQLRADGPPAIKGRYVDATTLAEHLAYDRCGAKTRSGGACGLPAGHTCQLCGAPATHVDHIVPVRSGGSDHPGNLRALCQRCNLRRGAG